jgi:sigma-E factor negative regulatory protein RseB
VLHIIHRVQGGRMNERVSVISQNGPGPTPGTEFIRNGSEWIGYYPEASVALLQTRNRSYGYLTALNGLSDDSARYYLITDGGPANVEAGAARKVAVEPRDTLRYGYRFWLDVKTGLPLKSQMVTSTGQVIQEISFISVSYPDRISDAQLKPAFDAGKFTWKRTDVPKYTPGLGRAVKPQADLLPAGFRVRLFTSPEEEAGAEGPRTRFIVSDGIAWVSVFVEKAPPAGVGKPLASKDMATKGGDKVPPRAGGRTDGVVLMGSSATYVARHDGFRVTVVGEVPPVTVKAIAEAVRPE